MASERWKKENVEKMRKYRREWYERNRQSEINKAKKRNTILRKKAKEWYNEYKKTLKCIECAETDWRCLDFHHRDPLKKTLSVALLVKRNSIKRLQEEIAKCDVLCSNCHRKHHIPLGD